MKVLFLIWTIALAGALEQFKTQLVAEYGSYVLIYSGFWAVFIGVAFLFKGFWEVETWNHFEEIVDKLNLMLLIPVFAAVYGVILVACARFLSLEIGLLAIFFSIPVSVFGTINWVNLFKKTGTSKAIKKSLVLD